VSGQFPNYFSGKTRSSGYGHENRILVTGGSGFIGTNLVEYYLAEPGFEVLNIDPVPPRNPEHSHVHRTISILDFESLEAVVHDFRPTTIFHLGARTDLDGNELEDYAANVAGVENLIRTIEGLDTKPRATLFASSRLVCRIGHMPSHAEDYCATTVYGQSKIRTEQIVRSMAARRFQWVLLRPTSIWGPWFSAPYRNFFEAVRRGVYVHPRGSAIRKSYGFVGNAVHQLDRLAFSAVEAAQYKTLYLCDYEPVEIGQWSAEIARSFDRREPLRAPELLLRAFARAGDFLEGTTGRHAPITSFRLDNILTEMVHDTNELSAIVGPLPFDSQEGVRLTRDWLVWDRARGGQF
jgi:nucleoside-diphosphate-sugar epimerase